MTVVLELPDLTTRLGLFEFDLPFALLLVPIAAYNGSVEVHVLAQIKRVADLVEVCPDVRRVAEEAWPVGILRCD